MMGDLSIGVPRVSEEKLPIPHRRRQRTVIELEAAVVDTANFDEAGMVLPF